MAGKSELIAGGSMTDKKRFEANLRDLVGAVRVEIVRDEWADLGEIASVAINHNRRTQESKTALQKYVEEAIQKVPPKRRKYLSCWAMGMDLRRMMGRNQFYYNRKVIKDAVGIDIALSVWQEMQIGAARASMNESDKPEE